MARELTVTRSVADSRSLAIVTRATEVHRAPCAGRRRRGEPAAGRLSIGLRLDGFDVRRRASSVEALRVLASRPGRCRAHRSDDAGPERARARAADSQRHSAVRVVLSSAYHLSARQVERADCGAVGFVPKPYRMRSSAGSCARRASAGRDLRPRRARMRRRLRRELLDYELAAELIARPPTGRARRRAPARPRRMRGPLDASQRSAISRASIARRARSLVVNDTRVVPARLLGRKRRQRRTRRVSWSPPRRGRAGVEHAGAASAGRALGGAGARARRRSAAGPPRSSSAGRILRASERAVLEERGEAGDGALLEVAPLLARGRDARGRDRRRSATCRFRRTCGRPDERGGSRALPDGLRARARRGRGADGGPPPLAPRCSSGSQARGVERAAITLHVGLGTFQPVTADDLDDHPMHAEAFEVPRRAACARSSGRARAARRSSRSGTTVVRALESAADPERAGHVRARRRARRACSSSRDTASASSIGSSPTSTCPQSTLLALVAAFAGTRAGPRRVPRGDRRALPVLLLRRRDVHPRARGRGARSVTPGFAFEVRASRRARARRRAHHAARRGRDAHVHAGRHAGQREDAHARRGRGDGRAHRPRQHLSPLASARAPRSSRAPAGSTRFTRWPHAMLTDSGGFQAFSLAERRTLERRRLRLSLAPRRLAPRALARGSDARAGPARRRHRHAARRLPARRRAARRTSRRPCATTTRWARRCLAAKAPRRRRSSASCKAAPHVDLRTRPRRRARRDALRRPGARRLLGRRAHPADARGRRRGGASRLDPARPRYLMGVGTPRDLARRHRRRRRHVRLRAPHPERAERPGAPPARPGRHQAGALQGRPRPARSHLRLPDVRRRLLARVPAPPLHGRRDPGAPPLLASTTSTSTARLVREAREAIAAGTFAAFARAFVAKQMDSCRATRLLVATPFGRLRCPGEVRFGSLPDPAVG